MAVGGVANIEGQGRTEYLVNIPPSKIRPCLVENSYRVTFLRPASVYLLRGTVATAMRQRLSREIERPLPGKIFRTRQS